MRISLRLTYTCALLAALLALPVRAESTCGAGQIDWKADLQQAIQKASGLDASKIDITRGKDEILAKVENAVSAQVSAPSSSQAGGSLVDQAFFSSLLAMAVENGLVKNDETTKTVNLNLFAFLAMVQPKVLFNQSEYEKYDWLRRVGGSVTSGGKGLKFDRDGDGKDDDPLDAKEINDIVNYEVRLRLGQSREPRESYNMIAILNAAKPFHEIFDQRENDLINRLISRDPSLAADCTDSAGWKTTLEANKGEVQKTAADLKATFEARNTEVEKIANRTVWTLIVGGVDRKPEFGPDSVKFGIHTDWRNSSFNVDWTRTRPLVGTTDIRSLKAGYKLSAKWFQGTPQAPDGVDVSGSASYEKAWDDPSAKHDTVAKANVAFEYPVAKGMKVPISVTWANHADLLTGEKDIRGHIGFTIDLSKLTDGAAVQ